MVSSSIMPPKALNSPRWAPSYLKGAGAVHTSTSYSTSKAIIVSNLRTDPLSHTPEVAHLLQHAFPWVSFFDGHSTHVSRTPTAIADADADAKTPISSCRQLFLCALSALHRRAYSDVRAQGL